MTRVEPFERHVHPHSKQILIVEDQSIDIVGPYTLAHQLGYQVSLAFDGGQAIELLKRKNFSLIILDWNMPYMSGSEFLSRIESVEPALGKSKSQNRVILNSGDPLAFEDFNEAKNFRVIDIWRKPMSPADMSKRLKHLVGR